MSYFEEILSKANEVKTSTRDIQLLFMQLSTRTTELLQLMNNPEYFEMYVPKLDNARRDFDRLIPIYNLIADIGIEMTKHYDTPK